MTHYFIMYYRGLSFMEGFPMESLYSGSSKTRFTYFKRGSVIVPDSNQSDWIYIIKSVSVLSIIMWSSHYNFGTVLSLHSYTFVRNSSNPHSEPRIKNDPTTTLPMKIFFETSAACEFVFWVLILSFLVSYKTYAALCNNS